MERRRDTRAWHLLAWVGVCAVVAAATTASPVQRLPNPGRHLAASCSVSSGEYYCPSTKSCKASWDQCDSIKDKNEKCTAEWLGLSWDLGSLQGRTFTILDAWRNKTSEFSYVFSICGNANLAASELSVDLQEACAVTSGAAGDVRDNPSPGYQTVNGQYCWRVGDDQSGGAKARSQRGTQMTWELLDPLNPAMGLQLTYTGGNTCKNSAGDTGKCTYQDSGGSTYCERGMRIRLVCQDKETDIPAVESVDEDAACMYEIRLNSQYACPTECARGADGTVCSSNGLCAFDAATTSAACACKQGYSGADCSEFSSITIIVESHYWRNLFVGVFIGSILGAICVFKRRRVMTVVSGIMNQLFAKPQGRSKFVYQRAALEEEEMNTTYSTTKERTEHWDRDRVL